MERNIILDTYCRNGKYHLRRFDHFISSNLRQKANTDQKKVTSCLTALPVSQTKSLNVRQFKFLYNTKFP